MRDGHVVFNLNIALSRRSHLTLPLPLAGEGWGGGLSPHIGLAESPPHPALRADLSPQAGRGESNSSFRGASKTRTRNLEIPRCAIAHLRSGPSDHPGMTVASDAMLRQRYTRNSFA